LKELLDYLSRKGALGSWEITRDKIQDILGLDITDIYRAVHKENNRIINFHKELYSESESGALISLLETLGYQGVEKAFCQRGLHLSALNLGELQEDFLFYVQNASEWHTLDYQTFLDIYDYQKNFHLAYPLYIEDFFDPKDFQAKAIKSFSLNHTAFQKNPGAYKLKQTMEELLNRRILDFPALFPGIHKKLRSFILTQREAPELRRSKGPDPTREARDEQDSKVHSSCQILTLREPFTLGDLKKAYKDKMRQYHPDINPKGLEMAKALNGAYAILLNHLKEE